MVPENEHHCRQCEDRHVHCPFPLLQESGKEAEGKEERQMQGRGGRRVSWERERKRARSNR